MIVEPSQSGGTVRKRAEDRAERLRLGREARILALARHPGVVQLLACDPDAVSPEALVLGSIDGRSLADVGSVPPAEVARLGAGVATVLTDLHDLGIVHGRVTATHVLVGQDGRPVLCSLGYGRVAGDRGGPGPADDVAALGAMLTGLLSQGVAGRGAPVALLRTLARAGRPSRRRRPDATDAWLPRWPGLTFDGPNDGAGEAATTWAGRASGGCRKLSQRADLEPAPAAGRRIGSLRGRRILAVAVGLTLVALGATGAMRAAGSNGHARRSGCPAVDAGCRPVSRPGSVLTAAGRYRIGGPDDQVVLGRWRCTGAALPALRRPSTGEVWAFDDWATPSTEVAGRLVARVAGARSLVVAPGPACDHLVVLGGSGPPITVAVWPPGPPPCDDLAPPAPLAIPPLTHRSACPRRVAGSGSDHRPD